MTDSHKKRRSPQPDKKKTTQLFIFIPLILLAIIAAILYFIPSTSPDNNSVSADQKIIREETPATSVAPQAKQDVPQVESLAHSLSSNGEKNIDKINQIADSSELDVEALEEENAGGALPSITPAGGCSAVGKNLQNFFRYLDKQEYISAFELETTSDAYFITLAHKLLDNPPVVVRESDDIYTILRNMAHFFRVIGKKNIGLIKSILSRERDKIENVAAELYKWIIEDACRDNYFPLVAPSDKMYEYAGFFLNTMGGRSYLFRRDSRCRLLVNYYSILIIDHADINNSNRYGISIAEILPSLISEIEASNQLIYKENYLDKLYELHERYQQ